MTAGKECRKSHNGAMMRSDVSGSLSVFDRFAARASNAASRAWFFTLCVLLVVLWVPSVFVLRDIDTWQLIINTITTIITFLLVAVLQNSHKRADQATQHKLNAIADGLADLMKKLAGEHPMLRRDCDELRDAVGLEQRESAVPRKGS
jgi:low affinity Fe/Cu permease